MSESAPTDRGADGDSRYRPFAYQDTPERGRLILRDGSTAALRRAGPEDRGAVRRFFSHLFPGDEALPRAFAKAGDFDGREEAAAYLCDDSTPAERGTLLVSRVVEGEERAVAAASYFDRREDTAQIAMAVEEGFRGRGLGTLLLEKLALLAIGQGISQFLAYTHPENRRMLEVFRNSGFTLQEQVEESDLLRVDLSVFPDTEGAERLALRERVATAASLRPFFKPRSVAVIGASREEGSLGFRVLESLVMSRFRGPVYPVNPEARVVGSIRAYPSARDLPEAVDLAVIVVPKQAVGRVVEDCAVRGVRALVVITAGFAETGDAGRRLQEEIVEKVRSHGMRMVGPNCMGLLNTDPEVRLNASFSPIFPPAGRVAMCSQSGALGMGILALARKLHLGLSTFVSIGNQADVAPSDLLQYWEEDGDTRVCLLYQESFGNPRRFGRVARRVSRSKPVVAVKGGRTRAGHRAAGSHTAALAASDAAVDALFRQSGVVRADTLEEMFELASVLESQPLPRGRQVGIVTNAGGPGILCADACEARGLELPRFPERLRRRLRESLPEEASVSNPVDMIASAGPADYRRIVREVLAAGPVDALVVLSVPLEASQAEAITRNICRGVAGGRRAGATDVPVVVCTLVEGGERPELRHDGERIPSFVFPETAARVLAKVADYAEWRRRPPGRYPDFADLRPEEARAVCERAVSERGRGWLTADETRRTLLSFGLPVVDGDVAGSPDEAARLAGEIGFPVAVKLASRQRVHKTEVGGVELGLESPDEVEEAYREIRRRLQEGGEADAMEGVVVQRMVTRGVELMVGVSEDEIFGPVAAFGLGGIHVEVLGDVTFRVCPLTDRDAREMVREIRGFPLLQGYRGHPPGDVEAIQEALLRVSRLVEQVPQIIEMDLNPVFALEPGRGCRIVDARIRVGRPDDR